MSELLGGKRILIVEDDYLAALDLREMVERRGGRVVGPVGRLDQALAMIQVEQLDGAILDIELDGGTSVPVADELTARVIPVIFATAYDIAMLPERYAGMPKIPKPFVETVVETTLRKVFGRG